MTTTTRTYTIWMRDTDQPAAWMNADGIVDYRLAGQDSGACSFRVETTDADALEAALDADTTVTRYRENE